MHFQKMGLIALQELYSIVLWPNASQKNAAVSLTERSSFLFVFLKSNYSIARKEIIIKLPPMPKIKCQPYHLEPE